MFGFTLRKDGAVVSYVVVTDIRQFACCAGKVKPWTLAGVKTSP
jgi:hypothetical protein